MNLAIYYDREGYTRDGPNLMGRHVAGHSFLKGYLAHARATEFWAVLRENGHGGSFAQEVAAAGRSEPVKLVGEKSIGAVAAPGTIYFPGPGIDELAWKRSLFGAAAWSLCGITHTTASAGAMESLTKLLTAPVQPWDAVICTSRAVRENVQRCLQAQSDYLAQRLGASRSVWPQLPIIPLGIDAASFRFTEGDRALARATLGAGEKTHVVLFFGRLSFHAKAHPLAMYQALELAAGKLPAGEEVMLVECGRHANEHIQRAFEEAARIACPSVKVVSLDGRQPESPKTAWAGADVFCSLSDNIQEAFGLTPLEAMAAGLPVVVSDWDGYKDTVRDGVDGFRIPTIMPGPGLGGDLAMRYALEADTYDAYCGHACSFVAVDVEVTAVAFGKLFGSADLRRKMGAAGRRRVEEEFDWKVIVPRYEALWAELAQLRHHGAAALKASSCPWPARMDPFAAFAGYPTTELRAQTMLALVDADAGSAIERVRRYRELAMVDFARAVLPSAAEIETILGEVAQTARPAIELVKGIPEKRRGAAFRGLAWLLKLGILRRVP